MVLVIGISSGIGILISYTCAVTRCIIVIAYNRAIRIGNLGKLIKSVVGEFGYVAQSILGLGEVSD